MNHYNFIQEYEENDYQFSAAFIYLLDGRLKDEEEDDVETWKSLPSQGRGGWIKIMAFQNDMKWFIRCGDERLNQRPNYDEL